VGVGEWWRESWWSEVDSVRVLDPLEPEPERGKKEKYKEKKMGYPAFVSSKRLF